VKVIEVRNVNIVFRLVSDRSMYSDYARKSVSLSKHTAAGGLGAMSRSGSIASV
jgi:hypothetical protein